MIIAAFIKNFANMTSVQHAFAGIRVAVAVLVINAIFKLWKSGIKYKVGIAIIRILWT
jgi:chromate transporter